MPTWTELRVLTWMGSCVRSSSARCPTRSPSHRYPQPPPSPLHPQLSYARLTLFFPGCFFQSPALSLISSPCDSLHLSAHTEPIRRNHFFYFAFTLTLIFLLPPFPFFLSPPSPCPCIFPPPLFFSLVSPVEAGVLPSNSFLPTLAARPLDLLDGLAD